MLMMVNDCCGNPKIMFVFAQLPTTEKSPANGLHVFFPWIQDQPGATHAPAQPLWAQPWYPTPAMEVEVIDDFCGSNVAWVEGLWIMIIPAM